MSVQLIDAYRDDHLWSAYFDRELDDIIGVQAEIALQVASKVKVVLLEDESFADAYAGLANAWFNLSVWGRLFR